ncbi:alpha/beta fold hydrolase [Microlunatus sp. Gsoil 973]|nr:alpha/beta fold hydrolase [Microlunatus sp. Gsoil 973]
MADDVARLRAILARQGGPVIVVGHSYGGQIITALGEDAPNVVGLVYVAAFGLDEGESIGALLAQGPGGPALAHLDIDEAGFAWLPEDDFVHHFAADVERTKAKIMFAVQQPLHWSALEAVMGVPSWKKLPSWFLIADGDQAIPPDAQRQFAPRMGATTVEVPTNHVAMVSPSGRSPAVDSSCDCCGGAGWSLSRVAPTRSLLEPSANAPPVVVVLGAEPLVQEPLLRANRSPQDQHNGDRKQHQTPERRDQQRQPQIQAEQSDVHRVAGEPIRPLFDHDVRRLARKQPGLAPGEQPQRPPVPTDEQQHK